MFEMGYLWNLDTLRVGLKQNNSFTDFIEHGVPTYLSTDAI